MSLQSQLNNDAITMLPLIKSAVKNAEAFESNQMINLTLKECLNSCTPLSDMSENQLEKFQTDLLDTFKYY